jgi:ArsR family transcriptional regulator
MAPLQPHILLARMSSLIDATRLRLLRLLEHQELSVADLCNILQLPQSTVSRHLKVLSDHGWIRSSRRATAHLYRMTQDGLETAARRMWLLARDQIGDWATIQHDDLRLTRELRQKQDRAQKFFAGTAARWDKLRRDLYGEDFVRWAMLSLIPPQYVVADLGCGTAHIAAELASVVRRVIAVDNSPAMLRAAAKRTSGLANVELRKGDLAELPIESRTCDAAVLLLALTYVIDPPKVLQEAHRILKTGGRLVIVDLLQHDNEDFRHQMGQLCCGLTLDEMRDLLAAAGFEDPTARAIPPSADAKGPALFLAAGCSGRSQLSE